MTPSGVPPTPISRSTPLPPRAAAIAGATSPSRIRFTFAPASRSSRIRPSCRSRSSTTTDTSVGRTPLASATASTFSVGDALMSIASIASGPHAILSMYTAAPGKNIVPRSATAITAIALVWPSAVSRVPSSGSTATSTCGPMPVPTVSPLNSIGASSFSPSPITTTPSIETVSIISRIASTAAWSAATLSPRPTQRPAARAAASVTRTSSSARLRSGRSSMAASLRGGRARAARSSILCSGRALARRRDEAAFGTPLERSAERVLDRRVRQAELPRRLRAVVAVAVEQRSNGLGADRRLAPQDPRDGPGDAAPGRDDPGRGEPDASGEPPDAFEQGDRVARGEGRARKQVALARRAARLGQQVALGAVVDVDQRDRAVDQQRKAAVRDLEQEPGRAAGPARSLHRRRVDRHHVDAERPGEPEHHLLGVVLRALV